MGRSHFHHQHCLLDLWFTLGVAQMEDNSKDKGWCSPPELGFFRGVCPLTIFISKKWWPVRRPSLLRWPNFFHVIIRRHDANLPDWPVDVMSLSRPSHSLQRIFYIAAYYIQQSVGVRFALCVEVCFVVCSLKHGESFDTSLMVFSQAVAQTPPCLFATSRHYQRDLPPRREAKIKTHNNTKLSPCFLFARTQQTWQRSSCLWPRPPPLICFNNNRSDNNNNISLVTWGMLKQEDVVVKLLRAWRIRAVG